MRRQNTSPAKQQQSIHLNELTESYGAVPPTRQDESERLMGNGTGMHFTAPQQEQELQQQAKQADQPSQSHSLSCWWPELLAVLLCIAGFVSLVVVLQQYDGASAQTAFAFGELTLSGLIAIISTITRAALTSFIAAALCQAKWLWFSPSSTTKKRPLRDMDLFDQASRSVWGGLSLLWALKGKGFQLASLGALLMVLGIAFDIFSQQVVSIDYRTVNSSIASGVARSVYYDAAPTWLNTNVDIPMAAAFYAGLMGSDPTQLTVSCPTSNCHYPVTPSLGVCGECTVVTSSLTYNNWTNGITYNISLPDGVSLIGEEDDETVFVVANTLTSDEDEDLYHYKTVSINSDSATLQQKDVYWLLAHFEAISIPTADEDVEDVYNNATAHECALWFCVKAYNVSVVSGAQEQQVIGNWSQTSYIGESWPETDNPSIGFSSIPESFNMEPGTNISFVASAVDALQDMASSALPGRATDESDVGDYYYNSTQAAIFASRNDLDGYVKGFADVLTSTLRSSWAANTSSSSVNNESYYYGGTMYTNKSRIKVRWAWLAFPCGMVVGALGFFAMIVWRTMRSSFVEPWKRSALVPLFLDVDERIQTVARSKLGGIGGEQELVDTIGNEKVSLYKIDRKWVLN